MVDPATVSDTYLMGNSRHPGFAAEAMANTAPTFSAGDELTGSMTPRHFDRIVAMIAEARDAGCAVADIDAGGVVDRRQRRHSLTPSRRP